MNYLTTDEMAELWNISPRRITKLCNEGRVEGAEFKGRIWLIPADAEKPEVQKRGRKPQRGELDGSK